LPGTPVRANMDVIDCPSGGSWRDGAVVSVAGCGVVGHFLATVRSSVW
jgi:hypothetical protein